MRNETALPGLPPELRFLQGGGEMGTRIREFAWEHTALGKPAHWSISLKTAVGIMLNSGAPAYIAWGQSFIQLYNDAYISILGKLKHPGALGLTTSQSWSEIWDFVGPLFKNVISSGEIVSMQDTLLPMHRNGYLEECYFTFSYSPLPDEDGRINGVFVTAWETTESVVRNRRSNVIKKLAEALSLATDMEEIKSAFETLAFDHAEDIPFALWYEAKRNRNQAELLALAGIVAGDLLSPKVFCFDDHPFYSGKIDSAHPSAAQYPISQVRLTRSLPLAAEPNTVYLTPVSYTNQLRPDEWLVFGMNPSRPSDAGQAAFFEQIKTQIELAVQRVNRNAAQRQEQQHEFESVLNAVPCLVWMSGTDKECYFFNRNWLEFRGSTLQQEAAGAWVEAIHPDDLEKVHTQYELAFDRQVAFSLEYRLKRSDGTYRWICDRSTPRYSMAGEFLGYIGNCLDITDHKNVTSALAESEARYRQIVETSQEGIWIIDTEGNTTFANSKLEEMLGCPSGGMDGRPVFQFMDAKAYDEASRLLDRRRNGIAEQREFQLKKADGTYLWALVSASPFKNQHDRYAGALAMVADITERKRQETKIKFLATHDGLTGLPNRNLLNDRLTQLIEFAERSSSEVGLLIIDFDNFKYINDSYGHTAGDILLQEAAGQLQQLVRQANTVARLGGDEFVILLPGLKDGSLNAAAVAQRIVSAFSKPMHAGELEIIATASIGISLYPADAKSPEELLKHADTALYQAKEAGRSRYQFYKKEMSARAMARASLEAALRKALELNEFKLHYQPQVSVADGRPIGVEALLRWKSPELGWVSPGTFIPIAEETGLIASIGEWVLRTACAQNKAWQRAGMPPLIMSVNLSAVQLKKADFLSSVMEVLKDTELEPGCLDLEITESMLVSKTESLVCLLTQLKQLGIHLSLDDFGTGYSNLGYLQAFPLTRLKIDRSFIHGVPENRDAAAISAAIVNMGHSLGLEVLAEGVETEAEAQFLDDIGCKHAQGYFYCEPLPADEVEQFLMQCR